MTYDSLTKWKHHVDIIGQAMGRTLSWLCVKMVGLPSGYD